MSITILAPSVIHATIQLPSSKSISNRVLIINALSKGEHKPCNLSTCDDTQMMLRALINDTNLIDIQAAGTAMRFLTAYLSVTAGTWQLTGSKRMQQRPIKVLVEALRELGATIRYLDKEGFPPLEIVGGDLSASTITLSGSVSSQYISALLLIAPMLRKGLTISLTGEVISLPYIRMTLALMQEFGAETRWVDSSTICIAPKPYTSQPFTVESDWSAASYWYQIVSLSDEARIVLPNLYLGSYQGDIAVSKIFSSLGVSTRFTAQGVLLTRCVRTATRFDYDFVNQPDLAQTLVVTCIGLGLPFRFTGLQSLRIKETDRMAALITELKKLGYLLHEADDSILYWEGERCQPLTECGVDTYEDHRMAMAFAPLSMVGGALLINDPEVVSKSYPNFWSDLQAAGFEVSE